MQYASLLLPSLCQLCFLINSVVFPLFAPHFLSSLSFSLFLSLSLSLSLPLSLFLSSLSLFLSLAQSCVGERCSLIETEAGNRANMLAGVLADIDKQIVDLEILIKEKER